MKKAFLFLLLLLMYACQDNEVILEPSVGETNQITVIIEDNLWNGEVGDSIRKKLTALVAGLPQEEPLFNLIQHTDQNGDDYFCKNRNIIIVEKAPEKNFEVRKDDFAENQSVIYLSGKNATEIIGVLEQNYDSIIKTVQVFEILETQKKIASSALDSKPIHQMFGFDISIPSDYEYVLEAEDFVWLKKENRNGSSNLLIYKTTFCESDQQSENLNHIIFVRDSIGAKYIHSKEDKKDSYQITGKAYAPYIANTKLQHKKAYQTKGTWEMRNIYMSGPFLNYTVLDQKNKRNIVLEGFIYAPSSSKRDMMHELEAIIKSVNFNE